MDKLRGRSKGLLRLPISAAVFLVLFPATALASEPVHRPTTDVHVSNHVQVAESACEGTLYPDLCVSTLSTFPDLTHRSMPEIIAAAINNTVTEVKYSESNCSAIRRKFQSLPALDRHAIADCLELLDNTIDELKTVISDLNPKKSPAKFYNDFRTFLSGAMTNMYTCLDGFAYSKSNIRPFIEGGLTNISHHVSNSLAMLKKIPGVNTSSSTPEYLPEGYGPVHDGFPAWLSGKDRKLLQTTVNGIKVDLVVAKDGSGNFTTITEAMAAAPNSSATRFVIYIKAGAYYEYVTVDKKKTNLTFIGEGMGKTLIKGNRSVVDGWTTYGSGTLTVEGAGFMAKGITVENYAGAIKHQAVALRSSSDLSVFYLCQFIGYQDTLYVHSLRQFYRNCEIYGTVDFIFGNAAVVIQNCSLYARKPLDGQKNLFTAQGRTDPGQNTGISILNCKVAAASDLLPNISSFKSYLGRPWKEYSRTVYLLSYIDSLIDPAGWLEWDGDLYLTTLYYGEYKNQGPGSNTSGRVTWAGYRVITNTTEASQFTVGNFIQGGYWLPAYGIPYYLSLTS